MFAVYLNTATSPDYRTADLIGHTHVHKQTLKKKTCLFCCVQVSLCLFRHEWSSLGGRVRKSRCVTPGWSMNTIFIHRKYQISHGDLDGISADPPSRETDLVMNKLPKWRFDLLWGAKRSTEVRNCGRHAVKKMSTVKMDSTCHQFSLYWFNFITLQTDK